MVQVLPQIQKRPSALELLGSGISESLPNAFGMLLQQKQNQANEAKQNRLIEAENLRFGIPQEAKTESLRKAHLEQSLKDKADQDFLSKLGIGNYTNQKSPAQTALLSEEPQPGMTEQKPRAGIAQQESSEPSAFTSPLANLSDEQLLGLSMTKKGAGLAKQAQSSKEFKQKQDIAEAKSEREERKFKQTQDIAERDYNLKVHGLSEDYAKKLREKADIAKNRLGIIEKSKQALKKTKTGALTLQNFFKTAYKDTPFENIALSPEGAIIEASIPTLLEGNKDIYGVRLSDRDLAVSLGKTISLGKSNDVNMAILEFNQDMDRLRVNKQKIADQILKENNGLRPLNFEGLVDQRFDQEYGNEIEHSLAKAMKDSGSGLILMRAPDGRLLNVPQEKVEEFKALKAKVL